MRAERSSDPGVVGKMCGAPLPAKAPCPLAARVGAAGRPCRPGRSRDSSRALAASTRPRTLARLVVTDDYGTDRPALPDRPFTTDAHEGLLRRFGEHAAPSAPIFREGLKSMCSTGAQFWPPSTAGGHQLTLRSSKFSANSCRLNHHRSSPKAQSTTRIQNATIVNPHYSCITYFWIGPWGVSNASKRRGILARWTGDSDCVVAG